MIKKLLNQFSTKNKALIKNQPTKNKSSENLSKTYLDLLGLCVGT